MRNGGRAWTCVFDAACVWFLVVQSACTVPEGEFNIYFGEGPPDEVSTRDANSPAGLLRVSKRLLSGEVSPDPPDKQGESPRVRPPWELTLLLEVSTTFSNGTFDDKDGYVIVDGVRFDPPVHLGVEWNATQTALVIQFRQELGAGFDASAAAGFGHAFLDVKYKPEHGDSLEEQVNLPGFDLRIGVGFHATAWLQFCAEADFLIRPGPIVTLDGIVVVRPWWVVGIIGGWRFWGFSDDKRSGSPLSLQSSGPVFGLELQF